MNNLPERKELPAPLLGCLYCHTEGTITEVAPRKILGIGRDLPALVCGHCGSVALLDEDGATGNWRIRYTRYSRQTQYHFSAQRLGKAGWLEADDALKISTTAYIQRQRVRQAQRGDLSWLQPQMLSPRPLGITPSEPIFLKFKYVTLHQEGHSEAEGTGRRGGNVLDGGQFYVTDIKLHLQGRDRDWSYEFGKIRKVDFSKNGWKIDLDVKEAARYFQGSNQDDEIDPQLAAAVITALWQQSHP